MKTILIMGCLATCMSCKTSIKLAIPTAFTEQATRMEVTGTRGKQMSFGKYSTSKIKRGSHSRGGRAGKSYFWENLVLNRFGVHKNDIITKEKDKFRYTITDGSDTAEVFSQESEVHRNLNFTIGNGGGFFEKISRLQYYNYFFSSTIFTGELPHQRWDMILSNTYDREKDSTNKLFTVIRDTINGFATNGVDTIVIRALNIRKTEAPDGKQGKLPFDLLAGYELVIEGGVVAVVNSMEKQIWFYKELDDDTRLVLAAISTAILAKRIKDVKW